VNADIVSILPNTAKALLWHHVVGGVLLLYLIPWLVAHYRPHPNQKAILVLDLFLGAFALTCGLLYGPVVIDFLLGCAVMAWLGAMVWSCLAQKTL
jgi:hypothetical protein